MWPDEGARSPWIFFWRGGGDDETNWNNVAQAKMYSSSILSCLSSIVCFLFNFPSFLSFKDWTAQVWVPEWYLWSYILNTCLLLPLRILFLLMTISRKAMESKEHWHSPPACLEAQKISFIFVWNDHLNSLSLGFRVLSFHYLFFEGWSVIPLMEYFSGKHEDP